MARRKTHAWANLKGVLPEFQADDVLSERQQKVNEAIAERTSKTMPELAKEFAALEEEEAAEDVVRSARQIKFEAIERRMSEELVRIHDLTGIDTWRGSNGEGTFSPQYIPRPRIVNREALYAWVREQQLQDLLTLPTGRLNTLVKDALNTEHAADMKPADRAALRPGYPASGAPPPGVEVYLQTTVHHTGTRRRSAASSFEGDED